MWQGAGMKTPLAAFAVLAAPALADAPQVMSAEMVRAGDHWTITVALSHEDSGWDHFASGFEVDMPDGTRIAYKDLTHPQTDSTRIEVSLGGLSVPQGTDHILIRTRCSLVGWSAEPVQVDLPRAKAISP
jgi:hypothetical protein